MAPKKFNPLLSTISDQQLQAFIKADLTGQLKKGVIPGIGDGTIKKLNTKAVEDGGWFKIKTVWQLFARFLMMAGQGSSFQEDADAFMALLDMVGTDPKYQANIVHALLEKFDCGFRMWDKEKNRPMEITDIWEGTPLTGDEEKKWIEYSLNDGGSLAEVPGLESRYLTAAGVLSADPHTPSRDVTNCLQLVGKFLSLKQAFSKSNVDVATEYEKWLETDMGVKRKKDRQKIGYSVALKLDVGFAVNLPKMILRARRKGWAKNKKRSNFSALLGTAQEGDDEEPAAPPRKAAPKAAAPPKKASCQEQAKAYFIVFLLLCVLFVVWKLYSFYQRIVDVGVFAAISGGSDGSSSQALEL